MRTQRRMPLMHEVVYYYRSRLYSSSTSGWYVTNVDKADKQDLDLICRPSDPSRPLPLYTITLILLCVYMYFIRRAPCPGPPARPSSLIIYMMNACAPFP